MPGPTPKVIELLRTHPKGGNPQTWPQLSAQIVEDAIRVVEGRWKMIIIFHLFARGTLRFGELERAIEGVTQKMLIQQLRELERDGVVTRQVFPVVPPKVEYSLTPLGERLCPALNELIIWGEERNRLTSQNADAPPPVAQTKLTQLAKPKRAS
jgi:DNA-binding HxlR family transcriptional regulator